MAAHSPARNALVVDDTPDQAELVELLLERLGYVVVTVNTAEAAIAAYAELEPQLAIVDLLLPGIDGWALVTAMKRDVPECRLLVTSVLGLEEYPVVDGVLPKPFSAADLAAELDRMFAA
ncbi:response regulator [Herbiconiux sp. UC225_62]|uniref:response regulator n=1 Tax=Herbiconiux sp. UC225_62 TaxID=3350168 RepID=UPI0036D3A8E2